MPRKIISVITPVYNEENNVRRCAETIAAIFDGPLRDYQCEHIFADNASSDGTLEELRAIAASDGSIKVIVNNRNYGPFRSMYNALMQSTGDAAIVLLAADLQDPPELIETFVRRWEDGFSVVQGVRAHREEGRMLRGMRWAYYRLVRWAADFDLPNDVGEFQLVDRKVIEKLRECEDYYPYLRGMIANLGFRTTSISYTWRRRDRGISKNNFYHLIDQALNGLVSSSNVLMRLMTFGGAAVAAVSLLYGLGNFIYHVLGFGSSASPGITTIFVAVFFFGGVQLLSLGIIGEYVAATHSQVRKRPLVVERERINMDIAVNSVPDLRAI